MLAVARLGFCAGAAFIGSGRPASAAACQLGYVASVPLIAPPGTGKLLVDATVDGSPVRLILDTGSEGVMLTEAAARRASKAVPIGSLIGGNDEIEGGFSSGVGGAHEVSELRSFQLGLGRMHGDFRAKVINEDFAVGSIHADGLLGMSLMAGFDEDLDLAGGKLNLYSTTGDCRQPDVTLNQPLYAVPLQGGYRSELRALVPVVINGQSFTALLDTGSPGVLLFAHTAARLGLGTGSAPAKKFQVSGIGGSNNATLQRVQTLAVGPLTLSNVAVAVDNEDIKEADLLLGLSFMQKIHVWVSNSSHMLVMQFPPAPSPPLNLAH
jgi:clan AA aspartic protease (TIGR02281 family)